MNEVELLALAKKEALQTTVTPDQFLLSVRTIPSYDYRQAHWYKAMKALEQLKKPPTPNPPLPSPSPSGLEIVRNLLILATVTDDLITDALNHLPPRWRFVFSADRAYWATDSQIQRVKSAGRPTGAWGDCSTTLPAAIKEFVASRGLGHAYGQCENPNQFSEARLGGLNEMVGKADAINAGQLQLVKTGEVKITHENYRNVNPAEKPDWRNANAGIGGNCIALYGSASEGAIYTSMQTYVNNGWFNAATDSVYTEGMTTADWQVLGSLG